MTGEWRVESGEWGVGRGEWGVEGVTRSDDGYFGCAGLEKFESWVMEGV